MTTDLETRLDELESRAAISDLSARYCQGVDRKDRETFLSIWHPDGKYLIGAGRGNFDGINEINRAIDVVGDKWKSTRHWPTNHVVTFEGPDRARGVSDAFAICEQHDGKPCLVAASYDDVYERRDGEWRILERDVSRWFVSAALEEDLLPPH